MVATIMRVNPSGTETGLAAEIAFSGTQFTNQGAVQLCLLCAQSGLAVIPVRCDSAGRIGSVA